MLPRLRPPILLLVASLAATTGLSAQVVSPSGPASRAGRSPDPNNLPIITTTLTPGAAFLLGEELQFDVTATDADGDLVSLRLLNPPSGLVFDPVKNGASPATVSVRGTIEPGYRSLVFEANDSSQPKKRVRLELPVRLVSGLLGARLVAGDVTGDGRLDLVARAGAADPGGAFDAGAIYVWAGASTPAGPPTATLTVPGAANFDALGSSGLQLADVNDDGVLDVVAGASLANVGGTTDTGAIYVFAGGAGMSGAVAPAATMAGPSSSDDLSSSGFHLVDVTDDGVIDIVATCPEKADGTGLGGAVYVYAGGAGLTGTPAPTATLENPNGVANDMFSNRTDGEKVLVDDVTGDGVPDLVVASQLADVGGTDRGGIWVFAGGAGLTGSVAPTASLRFTPSVNSDLLTVSTGQGLEIADVTGDGTLDVVAGAFNADVSGVTNAGAVYVWAGGAGMTGTVFQTALLRVSGAASTDSLTLTGGQGYLLCDVTDDGCLDVVAGARLANPGGIGDAGAVYMWAGGAGLTGTLSPTATMTVPGAVAADALTGSGLFCADVNDDGILDVVAGAEDANIGGVADTGAIYVFAGGVGLTGAVGPSASLTVPGAVADDELGEQSVQIVDVTGDGVLDLVATSPNADVGGVVDTGAAYVFAGGVGLTGAVSPSATLTVPGAVTGDKLGDQTAPIFGDLDDDGDPDVVVRAFRADVGGVSDAGAIYVFAGGAGLTGAVSPDATLTAPGAGTNDWLGQGGMQLADVSGDGRLDLLVPTPNADPGGIGASGAIYAWLGGASLSGAVSPSATLSVPGSVSSDNLGDRMAIADLTGDGVPDVLGGAPDADVGGVFNTGAIYLFAGGAGLSGSVVPLTSMTVPGAVSGDQLGN